MAARLQEGPVRSAVSWLEKEPLGNGNENILHLVNKETLLLHNVTYREHSNTHSLIYVGEYVSTASPYTLHRTE